MIFKRRPRVARPQQGGWALEQVSGIIPPYTIIPPGPPSGTLPVKRIGGPGIPPPYNSGKGMGINPPVPVGEGYLSRLGERVNSMDLIRGLDRLLGKEMLISPGPRQAMSMRLRGNFSVHEIHGRLSGRLSASPYGRLLDTVI